MPVGHFPDVEYHFIHNHHSRPDTEKIVTVGFTPGFYWHRNIYFLELKSSHW